VVALTRHLERDLPQEAEDGPQLEGLLGRADLGDIPADTLGELGRERRGTREKTVSDG
jgi:hypothetical protein